MRTKNEHKKCLTETELGAYVEDRLSPSEREDLEGHLLLCDQCRDEFIAVRRVMIRDDVVDVIEAPDHLMQKVISMFPEKRSILDLVLAFVQDSIKIISCAQDLRLVMPRFAEGLRSGGAAPSEIIVLRKSFEDINVRFDIEKVEKNLCNIRVSVDDIDEKKPQGAIRIGLISRGRELVSGLLENGETFLEDMGKGEYIIKIQNREKVIGEVALKIQ
ncbi:MAG: zf-HC2 domain-containing protein [Nitrospiraceae bacterium]|nr:MAG: zf-HC2 domain-containing protein [Nitrospiraceae bacterium]